jgi:tape measure domain-containing protein
MPNTVLTISGKNLSREAIAQLKADIDQTTKALQEQGKLTTQIDEKNKQVTQSYTGLTVALGATAAGLGLLTRSIVTAAMTQQKLMIGLSAVEGGAKGAEQAMKRLIEVAKLPGLTLQQATQGYISLRAIDMNAALAERSLKAFGNALVTVGKGAPELNLVVLALTQISAKGKVLGQDLRQLQEQLPQIRKVMKQAFGTADVEAVQKILEETGQTADQFIEQMVIGFEKLPKVTGGAANAVENFGDVLFRTKAALGEALLPYLIKLLDSLSAVAMKFQQLDPATRGAIAGMIAVGAGVATLALGLIGINKIIPEVIALFTKIAPALLSAGTAMVAFVVANPWIALAAAIAVVTTAIILYVRHANAAKMDVEALSKSFDAATESMNKMARADELINTMASLAKQTQKTKEDAIKYKEAKDELIKISPNFASALHDENLAMDDQVERARGVVSELKEMYETKLKLVKIKASESIETLGAEGTKLDKSIKLREERLMRMEASLRKDPNESISAIESGTTITISDVYKSTLEAQVKDMDALKELAEKRKKALQIIGPPPGLKSMPPVTPTDKGAMDFTTIEKEIADFTGKTGKGFGLETQGKISLWEKYLGVPEGLTEEAKRGVIHTIEELNEVLKKEQEKAEAERDKIWLEHAQATAKTSEKEYNPSVRTESSDISGVKVKPAELPYTPGQKGGLPYAITRGDVERQATTDYEKWKRVTEKTLAAEKAFDDDIKELKKKAQEEAADEQKKAQEEALKVVEQYRDAQLQLYQDMADSIGNIFAQIPNDLIKNFKDVSEVLKNMLNNILSVITNTIGTGIGISISNALTAGTGKKQAGGIGDILKTIMSFASLGANILAPGITPAIGAGTAGLTAVGDLFFDDPYNDLMAYQSGSKSAIAMTRKSSLDFINQFEKGFAKGTPSSESQGGLGDKLDKILAELSNNRYELFIDSDPIASKVRKTTNKKTNRGEWA